MRQRASGNGIGIVGVWAGSPLSSWAPVNLSSSQNLLGRTVSTPTAALRAQTIVTFHRGLPTQGQQPLYTGGESNKIFVPLQLEQDIDHCQIQ